jgi:hypothetical protein
MRSVILSAGRATWVRLAGVLVAGLALISVSGVSQAQASTMIGAKGASHAGPVTVFVRGIITNIHTVPCATSADLACTQSTLHGDLNGTSNSAVTSVVESGTAGVIFSNVTIVLTAPDGSTLDNSGSGVNNVSPASAGESVLLGELTGGTGRFAGASGYLQIRATFSAASGVPGSGDYQGELTLP